MDSLTFAIEMEIEGERYYEEQAQFNHDNSLRNVFLMLAADEKMHAEILKNKKASAHYSLKENPALKDVENVFAQLEAKEKVLADNKDQLEVYRLALDNERKSIELYEKLLGQAENEEEKALFTYLVHEEQGHLHLMEQLLEHLGRPENWVEAAEFGRREIY